MTRPIGELAVALVGALGLLLFLAWYEGRPLPAPSSETLTGSVIRDVPALPQVADTTFAATPVDNTTLIVGPLFGTVHAVPAPELALRIE